MMIAVAFTKNRVISLSLMAAGEAGTVSLTCVSCVRVCVSAITGNMYHMNAAWNMEDQLQVGAETELVFFLQIFSPFSVELIYSFVLSASMRHCRLQALV